MQLVISELVFVIIGYYISLNINKRHLQTFKIQFKKSRTCHR